MIHLFVTVWASEDSPLGFSEYLTNGWMKLDFSRAGKRIFIYKRNTVMFCNG